jgi:membrane-associated phospholipid phosphatase
MSDGNITAVRSERIGAMTDSLGPVGKRSTRARNHGLLVALECTLPHWRTRARCGPTDVEENVHSERIEVDNRGLHERRHDDERLRPAATLLGVTAVLAAVGVAWLARQVASRPTRLDKAARREALERQSSAARAVTTAVFALGYPAAYVSTALLTALWLRRRRAQGSGAVVASALAGWTTYRLVKLMVERDRPPSQLGEPEEHESFPSGHATGATAVTLTAAYVAARQQLVPLPRVIPLAVGLPLAVGVARVYADQHWATDVFGGWLAGVGVAALCAEVLEHSLSSASVRRRRLMSSD